ncbi:hypothetical protein ACQKRQ_38415 [Paraburkholderia sp. NPDC080076]|uniref:hypothetical protein n=1 Tax=Paraburkholderia sp. NPDC080076 TaxID=3390605 RepID=UPI003CFFBEA9
MQQFAGKVIKRRLASGSKSERDAIQLETDKGSYVLRREGCNPLFDPELDNLVGKFIKCTGELSGYTLTISAWSERP